MNTGIGFKKQNKTKKTYRHSNYEELKIYPLTVTTAAFPGMCHVSSKKQETNGTVMT